MSDLLLSLSRWLERNSPPLRDVVWLILRLYVANVFFKSGLTKIDDWSTTLFLFTEEKNNTAAQRILTDQRRPGVTFLPQKLQIQIRRQIKMPGQHQQQHDEKY